MEGIILSKISPNTFCRIGSGKLDPDPAVLNDPGICFEGVNDLSHTDFYLLTDPRNAMKQAMRHRKKGIHLLEDPKLSLVTAIPQALWDVTDRMFLTPKPYEWHYPIFQTLSLLVIYEIDGSLTELVILCDYEDSIPECELHFLHACPRKLRTAISSYDTMSSVLWSELESVSGFVRGQQHVDVSVGGRNVRIALVLDETREAPISSQDFQVGDDIISGMNFSRFTLGLGSYDLAQDSIEMTDEA